MAALRELLDLTAEPTLFLASVLALVASGTVYFRANGRHRGDNGSYRGDNGRSLQPIPVKSRTGRR